MQDRRIAEVLIKHLDCVNRVAVVIQTTVYQVHFSFKMTGKMISAYLGGGQASGSTPTPATSPLDALSAREREILRGIAQGASNKEIGRELGIAETTVKVHVQNVLRKLHVSTRVHAAVIATEIGLS